MTHRIIMPIRPSQRWYYSIDWRELSLVIRFERAGGRCEQCRKPHGQSVIAGLSGEWWDAERRHWRDAYGRRMASRPCPDRLAARQRPLAGFALTELRLTKVFIATAHLDQDPGNNSPRNLAALCQRCHLTHDRAAHRRQRWATLFYRRALGDLFGGPYSPERR